MNVISIAVKVIPNTARRKIPPSKTTSVKTNTSKSIRTHIAFHINTRDVKLHLSCKEYTIQPSSLQISRHEIRIKEKLDHQKRIKLHPKSKQTFRVSDLNSIHSNKKLNIKRSSYT